MSNFPHLELRRAELQKNISSLVYAENRRSAQYLTNEAAKEIGNIDRLMKHYDPDQNLAFVGDAVIDDSFLPAFRRMRWLEAECIAIESGGGDSVNLRNEFAEWDRIIRGYSGGA